MIVVILGPLGQMILALVSMRLIAKVACNGFHDHGISRTFLINQIGMVIKRQLHSWH
jgi:hypothetical protein